MEEKTLLQVSLIMVLLGLTFLYFYAQEVQIPTAQQLGNLPPEEEVRLQGVISRVSQQDRVAFIELQGERVETIDVVLFADEDVYLQEGDYVEITGTVEEYQGKKEVIASKIVKK
ncbi:MAG: OB-fold nucleic acid binding domain-containing protein [Nanoarchaeota archaeon]|nr:OB-fold nucleic acid binding domain-containing protein [Nanoarchaeota archaeon]